MKKEFLTFLILALGVASTAPVDAQQRAAQNRRRPQATASATAATPTNAPGSEAASDVSAAPERPANARPEGAPNAAPGRPGGPGFGGPMGRPGAFTLTRVRMEAIQAARVDGNKIDVAKFETEFSKGAKALDGDSDGVLSTEELAPRFDGPQGRPGAPGEGGPNAERRRPGRTGEGEEGAANARRRQRPQAGEDGAAPAPNARRERPQNGAQGAQDRRGPGGFPGAPGQGGPGAPQPPRESGWDKALAAATAEDGSVELAKLTAEVSKAVKAADADSDGFLDDAESREFNGFGGFGGGNFAPPAGMATRMAVESPRRKAVETATNADGAVEIAKFRSEFKSLLKAGDADGDGKLSNDEAQKMQEKEAEEMRKRFEEMRANGEGGGPGMGRGGFPGGPNGQGGPGAGGRGGFGRGMFGANENGEIVLADLPEQMPEEMRATMKEADKDGDGKLDADESAAMREAMQAQMRERFQQRAGQNGEGRGPGAGTGGRRGQFEQNGQDGENGRPNARNRRGGADGEENAERGPGRGGMPGGFPGGPNGQGGPGMGGRGGFPGMGGGFGGGFPGGFGGMRRAMSNAVQKALNETIDDKGALDLAKFDAELAKRLADCDNEDDGLLDALEQEEAFGRSPFGRRGQGGPNAGPGGFPGAPGRPGAGAPNQRGERGERGERPNAGANERGRNERPNARGAENRRPEDDPRMQTWGIPTPDDSFVAVAANPNFKFGKGAKNTGAGEKEAVEANYAIGVYEVRNREYKEFVDATGRKELPKGWADGTYPAGTKNCPVVGVTLKDVEDYCAWLATKHEGWTFRLPTEAEFENAAAGPKKLLYPWGAKGDFAYSKGELTTNCQYNGAVVAAFADAEIKVGDKTGKAGDLAKLSARGVVAKDAWRDSKTKSGFTYSDAFAKNSANGGFLVPVNKYDAESPYGMIGAAGNAAEMTSTVVDGKNVVRGGSWYSSAEECATTWRGETVDPTKGDPRVGFRVVAVRTDAPAPNAPVAE